MACCVDKTKQLERLPSEPVMIRFVGGGRSTGTRSFGVDGVIYSFKPGEAKTLPPRAAMTLLGMANLFELVEPEPASEPEKASEKKRPARRKKAAAKAKAADEDAG